MRVNELGEFEDTSEPKHTVVHTDEEKREALRKLMAMGEVAICDVCGRPFRTTGLQKHAKRCSWECKQEVNRRRARGRWRKGR